MTLMATDSPSTARTFYSGIIEAEVDVLKDVQERSFHPCKGNILVVILPKEEKTKGGLHIPAAQQKGPPMARVAAVPDDPECPVRPGDWVLFHLGADRPVRFSGRMDLAFLQYADGPESDLIGWFSPSDVGLDSL